jgi:hypothetical protein
MFSATAEGRHDVELLVHEAQPQRRGIGGVAEPPIRTIDGERHAICMNNARQNLDQG